MTAAGDEGYGTRTARSFFAKTCVFLRRGGNPAAELRKGNKIDCQSPSAELEIARPRNPILTGRQRQCDYLALAQMAKKTLKQVNEVLLQAQKGFFFLKSVGREM